MALASTFAMGCNLRVERPVLRPTSVSWLSVDRDRVSFRVTISAYNPNAFDLRVRELAARLFIQDRDTGATVTNLDAVLPGQREVAVTADLSVPFTGISLESLSAVLDSEVRYRVSGHVTVDRIISVRAPFEYRGSIGREVILGRALGALQGVLRGLFRVGSSGGSR